MVMKAVTFNMPVEVYQQLRLLVGPKKMSRFVSHAVQKMLSEEKHKLEHAYKEAENDKERKKSIKEWHVTEGENWA